MPILKIRLTPKSKVRNNVLITKMFSYCELCEGGGERGALQPGQCGGHRYGAGSEQQGHNRVETGPGW